MVTLQALKDSFHIAADKFKTTVSEKVLPPVVTSLGVTAVLHPHPIVSALGTIACTGFMAHKVLEGVVESPHFRAGAALVTAGFGFYSLYSAAIGILLVAGGKSLYDYCTKPRDLELDLERPEEEATTNEDPAPASPSADAASPRESSLPQSPIASELDEKHNGPEDATPPSTTDHDRALGDLHELETSLPFTPPSSASLSSPVTIDAPVTVSSSASLSNPATVSIPIHTGDAPVATPRRRPLLLAAAPGSDRSGGPAARTRAARKRKAVEETDIPGSTG